MNLLPARPQRVGETLDAGFQLYRRTFTRVLPLTAFSAVFGTIPGVLSALIGETSPNLLLGIIGVWFVLMLLVNSFTMGAVIALVGADAQGAPITFGQSLGVGLRRMFPMLGALIMYTLIIMSGFMLLIIPGMILMVSMMFCSYALILDRKGPIEALTVSHGLVWGRWWRTAMLVSVAVAVAFTLMAVFQLPFLLFMDDELVMAIGLEIGNMIGTAVGTPLIYAAMVVCYYELKLRAQGEDLEERIGAAAVPA